MREGGAERAGERDGIKDTRSLKDPLNTSNPPRPSGGEHTGDNKKLDHRHSPKQQLLSPKK